MNRQLKLVCTCIYLRMRYDHVIILRNESIAIKLVYGLVMIFPS